ncbi:Alpha/Beta hydrolase protein [Microdochium trichocladiopsis]|uniref:Alpha/Beta hydrolase protein n=1 Tax=Microdochium trichocladiopsis TaxID=1682393 RepID=A0A9P8Y672_9PEZI|nr:Alpha/Beta hydrolase protein [Microdochium trichocladiopsis]KAH7028822.1 Alpha/Beta hydrolase protein [Microdochium trichocladiopsis]
MYDRREEVEALGAHEDPDFAKLMASIAAGTANSNDLRTMLLTMPFIDLIKLWQAQPQIPNLPDTPTEFTLKTTMRDGHVGEVRVYKPRTTTTAEQQTTKKTALVVLIHGGGYHIGHWSHFATPARALAHLYGVTVCSVSYRLAPQHPFPTAPHDVWDSLSWLVSDAGLAALGGDVDPAGEGFVVGGASAGSNLAAVVTQKSALLSAGVAAAGATADEGKLASPITGLWLSLHAMYDETTVPDKYRHLWFSREQNATAAVIDTKGHDYILASYQSDPKSPDYCPGYGQGEAAPGKMPPTYFQVCGGDPLRDDGLVYEKVLGDAGVRTRLDVYPGVPHGFGELTDIPLALKSQRDTLRGFAWLLGKEEPSDEECVAARKTALEMDSP